MSSVEYPSKNWERDTRHTVSLVEECVRDNDSVLDIGCGSGFVLWQLGQSRSLSAAAGVDIVDCRMAPVPRFALYDGITIPAADAEFDVVLLTFVLHHVPNDRKPLLLAEARRVARRNVFVLEDTPTNFIDRFFNRRHGKKYRKQIGSDAPYGFYSKEEWERVFTDLGFAVSASRRIGRLSRNWRQPYARSVFLLDVPRNANASVPSRATPFPA